MFSKAYSSAFASTGQSVDSWNRQLRESMGSCWSARPPTGLNPSVSYKISAIDEFSLLGISVSSPVAYASTPSHSPGSRQRLFFIHMGSAPNCMHIRGKDLLQQPGECMLGDSAENTTSACLSPHSTICAGFPTEVLREYLPDAEEYVGKHLFQHSTYFRIVPRLLSSLYCITVMHGDNDRSRLIAGGLVKTFAKWCSVSRSDSFADFRISYERVRQTISSHICDPDLSVESIARMHGVSTRHLQKLFARRNDSVSNCIRRERLRGCVLDLRDVKSSARSITEIAFTWGFNSASHFSATFKSEYGLTAREYRRCKNREIPPQLRERIPGLLITASEELIT